MPPGPLTDLTVDPRGPDPLTVFEGGGDLRLDFDDADLALEFEAIGVPGRDGAAGADAVGAPHEWWPESAQQVWTIPHNLGRKPVISVALPDGEVIGCRVRHLDDNTASIEFGSPTSGVATLI